MSSPFLMLCWHIILKCKLRAITLKFYASANICLFRLSYDWRYSEYRYELRAICPITEHIILFYRHVRDCNKRIDPYSRDVGGG